MDAISHKPPLSAVALPTLLERSAAAFPDRTALSFEGRRWTYRDLATLVDRATAGLQRLGMKPGERIGLCLPNTPYYPIFYYAALKAGLVVVNYNPLYVAREMRQQIEDSETTAMVVIDLAGIYEKVAGIETLKRVIVCPFGGALPTLKRVAFALLKRKMVVRPKWTKRVVPYRKVIEAGVPATPVPIDPSDIAVLQYTGGTTGRPKGAMLTHANLAINRSSPARILGMW